MMGRSHEGSRLAQLRFIALSFPDLAAEKKAPVPNKSSSQELQHHFIIKIYAKKLCKNEILKELFLFDMINKGCLLNHKSS